MVRIAAQNEMKEDKMLKSLLYPLQSQYNSRVELQAARSMGIRLSSSALCFVTRMDTTELENKIRGLYYTQWLAHALESTLEKQ